MKREMENVLVNSQRYEALKSFAKYARDMTWATAVFYGVIFAGNKFIPGWDFAPSLANSIPYAFIIGNGFFKDTRENVTSRKII